MPRIANVEFRRKAAVRISITIAVLRALERNTERQHRRSTFRASRARTKAPLTPKAADSVGVATPR